MQASGAAALLAALGTADRAAAAELIVNGNFVAEDFNAAAAWLGVDDKYGTASQADDIAVWSDEAPNYGAILRICQDAAEVGGSAGGVWGAHIEQSLALEAGHTYTLGFWAADLGPNQADPACAHSPGHALQVQVYGQVAGTLLDQAVSVAPCSSTCGSTHSHQFVAPSDDSATLKFFFGGQWAKLKLAGVSLTDTTPSVPVGGDPGGTGVSIAVNQVGYLPQGPKLATVRTTATEGLPWELRDANGSPLASGTSSPFGADALSGDSLQRIDFSSFTGSGSGLRLAVAGATSAAFSVRSDVYAALARDSLRFYYYQRCGQALSQPQAENTAFARSLDHAGDGSASCSAGQSCNAGYPLNVSGGWHDAGDYGKYVVSGAVSVWTLMNLYERNARWNAAPASLGDSKLNTAPSNGVSDLLDEARQELEFLLGMQVPEGNPLAGMAHHKLHSDDWVPMPTHPDNDTSSRLLRPPSTAATLDLAAVAAQCARIWREFDPAFAARCQSAAERAWSAGQAHPALFAPANSNVGGGPYDDGSVGDEFYWAASELYATTGRAEYGDYLRSSSHFATFSSGSAPLSWPGTAGFGTISLALAANDLAAGDLSLVRQAIIDQADQLASIQDQNGYCVPLSGVIWGSNGDALNAGIVLALAYDLTGDDRYLKGAAAALDYVLGNNPLDRSYVTGYGAGAVTKIHHTNFAPYLNASFPQPPPGFIVGGPNSDLTAFADPGVSRSCSPLRCWSETSGAYWFIEVAVNWYAPLGWVS
ncbi:MAG TPA: glycoside hydrolase family 9 protein, partial [Polyangiaceae bacterium]|nr:glycoside hydrolase family 9 protein [Polyangiaceae bacterium]